MAELATIARPYAEALFKVAAAGDLAGIAAQLERVVAVAADPTLRQFSEHPKTSPEQVLALFSSVVGVPLSDAMQAFLRTVVVNGRVAALPEIGQQFHQLRNSHAGVADAVVYSAFPIDAAQWQELMGALEKKFGRKLNGEVRIDPELIGGVRVVVGDEVLDTSVRARLAQMKAALTA